MSAFEERLVEHGRMSPRVTPLLASTLSAIDWCDAFWIQLPAASSDDPLYWREAIFGPDRSGRPSGGLMRLRDLLARTVGLKPAATSHAHAFEVLAREGREVVVGLDDRHLDFRVSLTVRPWGSDFLVVTTAVRRHNRLGRAYFALVRGPHHVLVPRWTSRAVQRTAGAAA